MQYTFSIANDIHYPNFHELSPNIYAIKMLFLFTILPGGNPRPVSKSI